MTDDNPIKRWTAKRKASVVMDIFKGKTTAAEVARQYDLTVSEIEGCVDEAQRSMENGFRARPKDVREQYESELRETKEALGEAHLQMYALKKFRRLLDEDENS
ncbi:transposase [Halomonas cupida]|uniref:transposase n=1 Tax=Halomonas cupida TaxID=44933 RepID=UPI003EF5E74C